MRLRRSKLDGPGLTRKGRGRGFCYLDADGNPVTDPETLERLKALAVPPAWRDVWLCPFPNGHIQAVGTDEAGRRQYLYHEAWRTSRDAEKHERVRRLVRRLPDFRQTVEADLVRPGVSRERVLAVALRMLDHGVFRTGGAQYADEYGSRGAATLLRTDVCIRRGKLLFDFTAKGGQRRSLELADPELSKAVATLKRSRHDNPLLLVCKEGEGCRPILAEDVNERFKELVGDGHTVKDLRTWHATVYAAVVLAKAEPPRSKRATQSAIRQMLTEVSEELGNTPAVARRSYVDPRVVTQFERGRTIAPAIRRVGSNDLTRPMVRAALERSVVRLLSLD
ncbi:DNA topoisomerase IB [Kribbella deserti]|uniref:DNA topoisomerase n=1 Tax=Kribbella deserti TaxID=1926257 RepID=A0ABV6QIM8_9ACTN